MATTLDQHNLIADHDDEEDDFNMIEKLQGAGIG